MKAILDEMLAALSRGERVVLCSILASSGSVPRGAGAKVAVFEDGRVLGTIGGGAVERLSIQRAQDALKNGGSNELKSYNLHPSEVASTGMICGGAVTVYFQFFAPEQAADIAVLKRWREMLDKDVDLWLLLSLDGDGVNEFHVVTREEIPQDIGERKTILVAQAGKDYLVMVNPKIVDHSKQCYETEESCLSLTGQRPVKRTFASMWL